MLIIDMSRSRALDLELISRHTARTDIDCPVVSINSDWRGVCILVALRSGPFDLSIAIGDNKIESVLQHMRKG